MVTDEVWFALASGCTLEEQSWVPSLAFTFFQILLSLMLSLCSNASMGHRVKSSLPLIHHLSLNRGNGRRKGAKEMEDLTPTCRFLKDQEVQKADQSKSKPTQSRPCPAALTFPTSQRLIEFMNLGEVGEDLCWVLF